MNLLLLERGLHPDHQASNPTLSNTSPQSASLVLSTGSRAGLVASIHRGYYLVGRNGNCQIRPKSRSVSRTHCLLYYGIDPPESLDPNQPLPAPSVDAAKKPIPRFFVMDLNSAAGTRLNFSKIPPRQWVEVASGTQLRCGKIAWRVIIENQPVAVAPVEPAQSPAIKSRTIATPPSPPVVPRPELSVAATSPPENLTSEPNLLGPPPVVVPPSAPVLNQADALESESIADPGSSGDVDISPRMLQGEAWQEADVAAFLAAHDDVDRQARYDSIRASVQRKTEKTQQYGLDEVLDGSLNESETFIGESTSDINLATADTLVEESVETKTAVPDPEKLLSPAERKAIAAREKKEDKRKRAADRRAAAKEASARRVATLDGENPLVTKLKLAFAVVLTLAVLGFSAYQFIQFRSGPPPRVVDGID